MFTFSFQVGSHYNMHFKDVVQKIKIEMMTGSAPTFNIQLLSVNHGSKCYVMHGMI